jgi:hypothetical protein
VNDLTASRVALSAAIGAVLAWAAKAVVIWIAGGLDRSPAETPLFLLGLLCAVTAAVALAIAASKGREGTMRAVIPLGWIAAVVLVSGLLDWLITLPEPENPSWVWAEMELWALAVTLLAAVVLQRRLEGAAAG